MPSYLFFGEGNRPVNTVLARTPRATMRAARAYIRTDYYGPGPGLAGQTALGYRRTREVSHPQTAHPPFTGLRHRTADWQLAQDPFAGIPPQRPSRRLVAVPAGDQLAVDGSGTGLPDELWRGYALPAEQPRQAPVLIGHAGVREE